MLSEMLFAGILVPITVAVIEIRHKRTDDIILLRVDAATLAEADLSGAALFGARMTGLDCSRARLRSANLTGADLRNARLVGTDLSGAVLQSADLCGADLTGAVLTGAELSGARFDGATRWPAGYDPEAHGAVRAS